MITDPLFPQQWQLFPNFPWNTKAFFLWPEYLGRGVSVLVADDGFQVDHPDLVANIISHIDLETMRPDGRAQAENENHGTSVAGLIAAPINGLGVVGVAPGAGLVLARMNFNEDESEGHLPAQETRAFALARDHDVMNNSWGYGPLGDSWFDENFREAYANLEAAAREGRGGLGTIIVFSAGNEELDEESGLPMKFNSNLLNFQNHPYTIAVANLAEDGAIYSGEGNSLPGANVLVAAPGEGTVTTDRLPPDGYIPEDAYTDFGGTSAAAPVTSGVVALMLEANPNLGFRDVQEILAYSARQTAFMQARTNGAENWNLGGLTFSDAFGFGVVDALAAVRLAETWHKQSTARNQLEVEGSLTGLAGRELGRSLSYTFTVADSFTLEHVVLPVAIDGVSLDNLRIDLISPSGTRSTLIKDALVQTDGLQFAFTSAQFLGEDAVGRWTLEMTNTGSAGRIDEIGFSALGGNAPKAHVITDAVLDVSGTPVMDARGYAVINAAAFTGDSVINLRLDGGFAFGPTTGTIVSPESIQMVATGDGDDRIKVNALDNTVMAGRGNDIVFSGAGNNVILGGPGLDVAAYSGFAAGDLIITGNSLEAVVQGPIFTDSLFDTALIVTGDNAVTMLSPTAGILDFGLDPAFYLAMNPDVAMAGVDPLVHFLTNGLAESRMPNPLFDPAGYLESYADVRQAVELGLTTAVEHYYTQGWIMGYDPSMYFSTSAYLERYPEAAEAGMNPLEHYLRFGMNEGYTGFLA
ncbi:Proprotein convertase P-domain-containing protein [Desulfonatronum zhilinae]|nr:Proprotein convertase P-domain-containing protein [Desulfonatronum zhilinae]